MPLPSVINGATQCQVISRNTKNQCRNPAAYGCKACRVHGAHKSRNVLRGKNHPNYKTGTETKMARIERSEKIATLYFLRKVGENIGIFANSGRRGRKPKKAKL